jgi:23S rRNA-/tRNA-specific pseudouridylate synthase
MPRPSVPSDAVTGAGPLPILFEDDRLVVVVKPAGLATANVPAGVPSVHALLRRRWGSGAFVGIVSRLDAPVSGVLVVARTPDAAAELARQFRGRRVEKIYAAIVEGRFPGPLGTWQEWGDTIVRTPGESRSALGGPAIGSLRRHRASRRSPQPAFVPQAQSAHARARVVRRAGEVSLVELLPTTGRRHQLRVQLASRGCPIVGDRLYGARLPCATGIALHARTIAFDHPGDGTRRTFTAAWPVAWSERYAALLEDGRAP